MSHHLSHEIGKENIKTGDAGSAMELVKMERNDHTVLLIKARDDQIRSDAGLRKGNSI